MSFVYCTDDVCACACIGLLLKVLSVNAYFAHCLHLVYTVSPLCMFFIMCNLTNISSSAEEQYKVETKTIAVDFGMSDIYPKIEAGLAGLEIGVLGKMVDLYEPLIPRYGSAHASCSPHVTHQYLLSLRLNFLLLCVLI